ncbi:Unknown protein, partial [Striga hermonthica]
SITTPPPRQLSPPLVRVNVPLLTSPRHPRPQSAPQGSRRSHLHLRDTPRPQSFPKAAVDPTAPSPQSSSFEIKVDRQRQPGCAIVSPYLPESYRRYARKECAFDR